MQKYAWRRELDRWDGRYHGSRLSCMNTTSTALFHFLCNPSHKTVPQQEGILHTDKQDFCVLNLRQPYKKLSAKNITANLFSRQLDISKTQRRTQRILRSPTRSHHTQRAAAFSFRFAPGRSRELERRRSTTVRHLLAAPSPQETGRRRAALPRLRGKGRKAPWA